ncbi:MAG TPA: HD domain-containing protein [Candidatus Saccharimonadales bacterium]|nr:HD domain-containing protein [Candidatus Saccharimonadales bacterium]
MQQKIEAFKQHLAEISANPQFVHHKWFVKWHLEIVERLSLELADLHPEADRDLVQVMAWLHDYGKILDFAHQNDRALLNKGQDELVRIGFAPDFAAKAADYVEWLDKKMEVDLREAPIEVQIVSTADGCSHFVGPFTYIFWHEATDATFTNKTVEQLMELNISKANKDWNRKIVLPEARNAFEGRYHYLLERSGILPERFFS